MMPRPLILLATLFLMTGCTTTKEVGPRGDATLYATKSWWPMVYPYSITFEQIPIDRPGRHRFNVIGLDEAPMINFDLCVGSTEPLVDPSGGGLNKKPLPSAGFKSCIIHLKIMDDRGVQLYAETLRLAEAMWFLESLQRGNHSISHRISPGSPQLAESMRYLESLRHGNNSISHRIAPPQPNYPEGDFAISVEVLKPSKTTGDYLKIVGLGFPQFSASTSN